MLEERHFYRKPPREGSITMAIVYKLDILDALKSKGYNTNRLRKEKLLSESVIQGLRENRYITLTNISTICALLECQPGDLLEFVPGEK
jgi:putative transcriptional regulator